MTSFRFLQFLLFLLLHQVYSKEPELVFKAEGTMIEMGYCFGVDYIVVYRAAPEGDQLLGNSSADSAPITPPADLQGRIHISKHSQLLGLKIGNLTHLDSGTYRRECWEDQTRSNQHTQQLSVCNEEIESQEIIVSKEDGAAELLCNSTSIGIEGTSVHWYYELPPMFWPTLFLDSSVSLSPLVEDLQGVVEVRDRGALLLLNNTKLINYQHFYCLVIKGGKCLSFQNMYMADTDESRDIFASHGERVVLPCTSDGNNQWWETPLGVINGSSMRSNQMFISSDNKTSEYSLVISAASDEHDGDYSCISASHEIQYTLVLCPKKTVKGKNGSEAGKVSLECDVGQQDSHTVQWYRREASGAHEQISYSDDETVSIPEDLRGRLTPSHNGFSLTLSDLVKEDEGVYWCVVSREPEFLVVESDYDDDYGEEETEDDESSDGPQWHVEEHRCIFKQETVLSVIKRGRHGPLPSVEVTTDFEARPTADPQTDSTGYALGIGLAALLVVAVIVTVIVIKRRAKAPPRRCQNNDIKMNVEPSCTESLTQNDEFNA